MPAARHEAHRLALFPPERAEIATPIVTAELIDDLLHRLDRPLSETDGTYRGQRDQARSRLRLHLGHDRPNAVAAGMISQENSDLPLVDPYIVRNLDLAKVVCWKTPAGHRDVRTELVLHAAGKLGR